MRAAAVTKRIAETSPRTRARITGVGLFGLLSDGNIRRGLRWPQPACSYDAVNLIAHAFYIALALLLYYMFKPVNRSLSLLAALFSLAGCANEVLGLFHLAPYKINSLVFFGPYCLLIGYLIYRSPSCLGFWAF